MTYSEAAIDYAKIGKRISDRRKELEMTQAELAEKVDISNNYLSAIERGRKHPAIEIWVSICDNLGISLDYLFSGIIRANADIEISEKLKSCSDESREVLSDIMDIFIRLDKSKKR